MAPRLNGKPGVLRKETGRPAELETGWSPNGKPERNGLRARGRARDRARGGQSAARIGECRVSATLNNMILISK